MRFKKLLALMVVTALGLTLQFAALAGQGQPAQAKFAALEKLVKDSRPRTGAPGITVAVVQNNQLVWEGGDGQADVEHQVPATAETVLRVGSITKTVTAIGVLQLVEKGKLNLDDTIDKYIPYYPKARASVITVRHLLTHTSGIRHYHYEIGEKEGNPPQYFPSLKDAHNIYGVAEEPLQFAPGTKFMYTTYGFRLLGEVISSASGVHWEAYLHENVFKPAGMKSARYDHPLEVVPHRSRGYRREGQGNPREGIIHPWPAGAQLINAPYVDFSYKAPAASIIATAGDLGRYVIALNSGKLLKPETLKLMYAPYTYPDGTKGPYGLGWRINSDKKGRVWASHGGGATGHTASLRYSPDAKFAVAILTNVEGAENLQNLANQITDQLLDGLSTTSNGQEPR
jgi:CubicO group peptidase (beta-lactamase class C family)